MKTIIVLSFLIFTTLLIGQNGDSTLSLEPRFMGIRYLKNKEKISKSEFKELLKKNTEAYQLYKKGKTQGSIANIIGIPSGLVFGFSLGYWVASVKRPNMILFTSSGILWGSSLVLSYLGSTKISNSLELYNNKETKVSINALLNTYGIGFAVKF